MIIESEEVIADIETSDNVIEVIETYDFDLPSGVPASAFTAKGDILIGTGDGAYTPQPIGEDGQFWQADSAEASGGKYAYPSVSVEDSRNFIINGGFDFAQRQTPGTLTTISDQAYGPDRWKMERANAGLQYNRASAIGVSGLNCKYYGVFTKITSGGKILPYQIISNNDTIPLRGRTVTFSIKAMHTANSYWTFGILELGSAGTADSIPAPLVTAWNGASVNPTFGSNVTLVGSTQVLCPPSTWKQITVTVDISSDCHNIIIGGWPANAAQTGALSLAEVGIYLGESALVWTPRRYQEELELCERYFRKSYDPDTAPGTASVNGMITARAYSTSVCAVGEHFARPMRSASPTLKPYSYNGTANKISDTALADKGTTVTLGNSSMRGPRTATDSGTGFTSGNTHLLHYTAEAEL